MPTYRFIDTETNEVFESFMKISERDEFFKANPNVQSVVMAPMIVSSVAGMGSHRVSDGFKEVLSKVAEAHPGSEVGNRYGKKSIKEARTSEIVKKHVDKITKRQNNK